MNRRELDQSPPWSGSSPSEPASLPKHGGPLIRTYEGTLDRFTGDGMMVFFNEPLPCPDAPERAAKLAIEMRDAVARLGETWRKRGRHQPGSQALRRGGRRRGAC